jgi:alkylated DNA repair dioxygenase AlkB
MRISLVFGAWLDHEPVWLPPEEADAVLPALRDELPWEQREIVLFGRRILQPRLIAWAGDVGYRYSGRRSSRDPSHRQPEDSWLASASGLVCPSTMSWPTATGVAMTAWGFTPTTSLSSAKTQWLRLCRSARPAGSP